MFKCIGADGREYGPVSREQLRQWIREGRANARSRVRPDDAPDWVTLGELEGFEDVLGRRPEVVPPPSAHSPLAEDVLTRDVELDLGRCFGQGLDLLRNQFGLVFGAAGLYLVIQLAISGLGSLPLIGPVLSIGSLFVMGHLMAGVYLVTMKALRGDGTEVGDVFLGFKTSYVQLLLCYIVMILGWCVACLPGLVVMLVPIIVMIAQESVTVGMSILLVIGLVVMLVPAIYLTVIWMFALPLVIDKGLTFWDAMETNRKVVQRRWFSVFGLLILVGLLNMVGVLLCCFGMFLSFPLGIAATSCAYETLFSERETAAT